MFRSRDSIKVGTALRNAADLLRTPLGFLKLFLVFADGQHKSRGMCTTLARSTRHGIPDFVVEWSQADDSRRMCA